jgi:hypothetical protein
LSYGSTFTANLTRDQLITLAYKDIGALADGETLSSSLLADGILKLNLIIRELDATGKWLWTEKSTSITLVANQWVYDSTSGLPTDLREPDRISYRDGLADDWPVELVTREGYEAINNKTQQGDPAKAWLTVNRAIGSQTLTIWPALATVNTQSVITGTDAIVYKCIRGHTADSTNHPITGANYPLYWIAGGAGPTVWTTGTSYVAPQQLLLWYRRPLYEFTSAADNPDMPTQWTRLLEYRLAADLADPMGSPIETCQKMAAKASAAYQDVFKSVKPQSTDFHNKCVYL